MEPRTWREMERKKAARTPLFRRLSSIMCCWFAKRSFPTSTLELFLLLQEILYSTLMCQPFSKGFGGTLRREKQRMKEGDDANGELVCTWIRDGVAFLERVFHPSTDTASFAFHSCSTGFLSSVSLSGCLEARVVIAHDN